MKKFKLTMIVSFTVMRIILCASVAIAQQYNFTLDFEGGTLSGWTSEGLAFQYQPTLDDNPTARNRGERSNHQGKYWIGTYEQYQGLPGQKPGQYQGDRPTGTLTSASFVIPNGTLSFLVGGGNRYETRVELLVEDPVEGSIGAQHATGGDTETMRRVTWDLRPYAGKTGRICIVDSSFGPWGHINADDFQFSSGLVTKQKPYPGIDNLSKIRPARLPTVGAEPKAIIYPEYREVIQGERVEFESRSSPVDTIIREVWTGPSGQSASGRRFAIDTSALELGRHKVELSVADRNKRTGRASATLVIVPPPQVPPKIPPEARYRVKLSASADSIGIGQSVRFRALPDRDIRGAEFDFNFGDGSPVTRTRESEIDHTYTRRDEFDAFVSVSGVGGTTGRSNVVKIRVTDFLQGITLSLRLDHNNISVEERILFRAVASRPLSDAQYRFIFGDDTSSDWAVNPEIEHAYRQEGSYQAQAFMQASGGRAVGSSQVTITVRRRQGPLDDTLKTAIIIGTAAVIVVATYLARRSREKKKRRGRNEPVRAFQAEPHIDQGEQFIGSGQRLDLEYELQIRPVADPGAQEIAASGPLITDESHESREKK
jgi:hypothetical protein